MMNRQPHILAWIFLMLSTLLSVGCIEEMRMDTGEVSKVVVNCLLKEGDTQTMELYYSSGAKDDERRPVTDAEVLLSSYDQTVSRFRYDSGCSWSTQFTPKYGTLYKLKVITGGDTLSAQTRFPDDIDVAAYMKGRYSDSSRHHYFVFISYELRYFSDTVFLNSETPYEQIDFKIRYGESYSSACNLWVFPHNLGRRSGYENYIGTTHPLADNFNLSSLYVKDLPCFSRDSILAMDSESVRKELEWYPVIYPDLQLHETFVRISVPANYAMDMSQKELTNTPVYSPRAFVLVRDFPTKYKPRYKYEIAILNAKLFDFYFLSDEADRYFKDAYSKQYNGDDFLFEYDTENVSSNIKGGGLGLFGAMIVRNNLNASDGYFCDADPDYVYTGE